MARSLRAELLAWLLVPLATVMLVNVWTTYVRARETANLVTDRMLLASARVIAEQVKDTDGHIEALIPPSALEMFVSDERDRVVYRVDAPSGALVAGFPDVARPPEPPAGLEPLGFEARFRTEPIRAVALGQPIVSQEATGRAIVVVGVTLRGRDHLMAGLWINALRDQLLLVAAAAGLALFGLTRGLAPLLRLRADVLRRDALSLAPFPLDPVQVELRPLLQALNHALGRVENYVALQRRFIANAAHQLRTPLAVLRTQAIVGLRDANSHGKDEALGAINASVNAMAHLVNQLLTLARAEPGGDLLRKETVDMGLVTRAALERLAPIAIDHGVDLAFLTDQAPVPVHGHLTLLQELVANLVDNALAFTPWGGTITVSLRQHDGAAVLQVEDTGPGIPEAERERVFERFYRLAGAPPGGTGLGLAIVREIVAAHAGGVALASRAPAPGLLVTVRLPAPALNAHPAAAPAATSPDGSRPASSGTPPATPRS